MGKHDIAVMSEDLGSSAKCKFDFGVSVDISFCEDAQCIPRPTQLVGCEKALFRTGVFRV